MVSWSTIQTLLIVVGPLVYSKAKALYYSTKVSTPPIPLSRSTRYTLNVLFLCALISLASTFPYFTPENIFLTTGSRLQTPTDVLFNRLARLRHLTESDELLRKRLQTKDGRLYYAAFGPTPVAECNWCSLDEPTTFLWYALPGMAAPHLAHIAVLGLVTSGLFSRYGRLWRTQAVIGAAIVFLVELWFVGVSGDHYVKNSIARSEKEVIWTHWRMRMVRGVGVAMLDGLLGYALYLTGTRRWSVGWEEEAVEETMEAIGKTLERASGRLQAGNFIKQTVMRDKELRDKALEFWATEENLGKEMDADEEVQKVRMSSLPLRMDLDQLTREATARSEGLLANVLRDRAAATSSG